MKSYGWALIQDNSPYKKKGDFIGGTLDQNSPANAGDTGSIPAPGRFHMP